MSTTSEDLNDRLKQSGSGQRSPKRTDEHDLWMSEALGATLGADGGAKPKADAVDAKGAADLWNQLKPRCEALQGEKQPLHDLLGGVTTPFVKAQAEFKKLIPALEGALQSSPAADTLPAQVKTISDLLVAGEASLRTARDKMAVLEKKDALSDRYLAARGAVKSFKDAPKWASDIWTALYDATESGPWRKADVAATQVLLDGFVKKLESAEDAKVKVAETVRPMEAVRPAAASALSGSAASTDALKQLKVDLDAYDQGIAAATPAQARALAAPVRQALAALTLAKLGGPKAGKNAKRKTLMSLPKEELLALGGSKDGCDELDRLVGDIGSAAKSKEDKAFVKAALAARFGIESLEGDLTTKALPRLYKVMGMLPNAHTQDNGRLRAIKRQRDSGEGASWYKDADDAAELNVERTGTFRGAFEKEKLNNKTVKSFDTTALHEIGHAVDARFGFMDGQGKSAAYGGWKKVTVDDVVEVAGADRPLKAGEAFFKQYSQLGTAFLKGYLKQVLLGQEGVAKAAASKKDGPEEMATRLAGDPAIAEAITLRDDNKKADGSIPQVTQDKLVVKAMKKCTVKDKSEREIVLKVVKDVLGDQKAKGDKAALKSLIRSCTVAEPEADVDWNELAKHPAVKWCQGVRMNGAHDGLWDLGKTGASDYAVGSRVYQEAYKGNWWSYDLAARSHGVSNYQFRAPGEWFAELYAAYYQKVISPSHVDAKWFKTEIHERQG